nr:metalloregulator ArsR/SmtB family transcription factor [Kibdelosporangium sp. MJ126-NF4]CEL13784.1 Transcriptional regulator, ArsR family [Kibdelosporangium sp. MJ126-NF4]CTQ88152.1 Transcriptional regulator, ArsR family [Kibdelosporangium sp. MJ126-NF4]
MARPTVSSDVYHAVADPTRRGVLEALRDHQELAVSAIAEQLDVGMPLLSRHLAVLRAAGLVTEQRNGRQRLYRLQPEPLHQLHDWAATFAEFWAERLHSLTDYLRDTDTDTEGPHPDAP